MKLRRRRTSVPGIFKTLDNPTPNFLRNIFYFYPNNTHQNTKIWLK